MLLLLSRFCHVLQLVQNLHLYGLWNIVKDTKEISLRYDIGLFHNVRSCHGHPKYFLNHYTHCFCELHIKSTMP